MTPVTFRQRANNEIGTPKALNSDPAARRMAGMRMTAAAAFPPMEEMRDRAREIRLHTLSKLDHYLDLFATAVEENGGTVFFAADADEANRYISDLALDRGVRSVVKSKSMVTEEIELNAHLESAGLEVVESDLGEFIVQISGDRPSHIIVPVAHRTRSEINQIARSHLRSIFLAADMGVSGVNFGVAETGTITTVTNEGNPRLCTIAPRIHVAVMGMERIVPTAGDLAVMLEVLARSAAGQALSVYTNLMTGPRRDDDPDGPEELHVVILDNGRSDVLGSETTEILACIRCGRVSTSAPSSRRSAAMHTEASTRGPSGPYSPRRCSGTASGEICRSPRRCVEHAAMPARSGSTSPSSCSSSGQRSPVSSPGSGPGMAAYRRLATNPVLWRAFLAAGGVFGRVTGDWITRLPFHAGNWTTTRDLPSPASQSFHSWWKEHRG